MGISTSERQRRSDLARQMHADGRLGSRRVAKQAAARSVEVRSARASTIARRLLEDHQEEIRATLLDIMKKGTRTEKLKAIDIMVKAGLRGEAAGLNEHKIYGEQQSREEALALLASKLTSGPAAA